MCLPHLASCFFGLLFSVEHFIALLGVALGFEHAIKYGITGIEYINASDGEIVRNNVGDDSMIG